MGKKRRRRGPGNKAKAQRRHAKRRAYDRYGIAIDPDEIVRRIQNGEATFVERQSNRVTVWEVEVQADKMHVVYDKKRKQIVTVLYPDGPLI